MIKKIIVFAFLVIGMTSLGHAQTKSAVTFQKQASLEKSDESLNVTATSNTMNQNEVKMISLKPATKANSNVKLTVVKNSEKSEGQHPVQKITLSPTKQYQPVKMTFKKMNEIP